jgi:hypothetical protein
MKKALLGLTGLLLVGFVAVVVVFYLSLNTMVVEGVQRLGPKLTHTSVKLKKAYINVFDGQAVLEGLELGNPEGFSGPFAAKVESIRLKVDLASFASDKIVIQELELIGPVFNLAWSGQSDNFEALRENLERAAGKQSASPGSGGRRLAPAPAGRERTKLQVNNLVIKRGKVTLGGGTGQDQSVDLPYLNLKNIGQGDDGVTPDQLISLILGSLDAQVQMAASKLLGGKGGDKLRQKMQQGLEGATGQIKQMYGK